MKNKFLDLDLLNLENENYDKIYKKENLFKKFFKYIFLPIQKEERNIINNGMVYPKTYHSNIIKNTNYNIYSFIPKFLFKQFNSIYNIFYLLICISQLFKSLKIGNLFSFIFPICFIIFLSGIKEIYLEIKKYFKDKKLNNSIYLKYKNGIFVEIKSEEIRVGDVIKINKEQRIPADILILWSSNLNGITNVKTDQIDGETDWKIKKSLKISQKQINSFIKMKTKTDAIWKGKVTISAPNDKIYNIDGLFYGENNDIEKIKLQNCAWSNMKNVTDEIIGLVLYVGKETKLNLNTKRGNIKIGKVDKEINYLSLILFILIFIFSTVLSFLAGKLIKQTILLSIMRNIVLLSSIIPISLKANIDFSKIFYMLQINKEKSIKGTILRNSNISEELGRVEYLLSDKTGTLTQNKMIFKTFSLKEKNFIENEFNKIKEIINNKNYSKISNFSSNLSNSKYSKNEFLYNNFELKSQLNKFLESLILCHNVTPIKINNERVLQGSSPDEVSWVNFVESLGYKLLEKNENLIKFEDLSKNIHEYKIVENFPFTSERKRMGILLEKDNIYRFILKGADCVINPKLNDKESLFSYEQTENLSKKGLRTLVFGDNWFSKEFYLKWKKKYNEVQKLKNSQKLEENLIEKLENNISLVGVSGVEDLLQDDVKKIIFNIREANIKVWMLTGDKCETAKCIAISTGFKNRFQNFYEIIDFISKEEIIKKLKNYNKKDLLIISGSVLEIILNNKKLKDYFIKISSKSNSVVICRCSPKQKAEIALWLKNKLKKIVCSIGDGGNDVGMIKCSSFGIGLEGLEGKQAALASDASILHFKYLEDWLFWYGRLNYLRTSKIFHFSISRGFLISFIQIIFIFLFYFISISIYNSNWVMMYCSIYTSFLLVPILFDEDIPKDQIYNYPILYKYVQKGFYLNIKQFLKYTCISIFQSFIILFLYILYFRREINSLAMITFSSLILVEIINVFILIRKHNKVIYIFSSITLLIYILCSYIGSSYFDFVEINFLKIIIIIILSISATLPIIIFKIIKFFWFPSPMEKVIKEANKKIKKKFINKIY